MAVAELHERYAPVMHFSRAERFFPMSVDDFLGYCALYGKGQDAPLLPAGGVSPRLVHRVGDQDTFLRSVDVGPLFGADVARQWGAETLALLGRWSTSSPFTWSAAAARKAYDWFSEKTQEATKHFWWNKLLLGHEAAGTSRGVRASLPRFRLPGDVRAVALVNYDRSQGSRRNYTYYYRAVQQGEYLSLQYWFFYAFNDWASAFDGFNDHEGDWEGIQLFFRASDGRAIVEPPAYICFLGHDSRITKPWDHPDVERTGTHPHVYVAAGSHASYPEPKPYIIMSLYNLIDLATGDALTLDHDGWRSRINLDQVPWVHGYTGSWGTRYWLALDWLQKRLGLVRARAPGELHLPGVSAPRGPRFNDEGGERETWSNASAFAGIVGSPGDRAG